MLKQLLRGKLHKSWRNCNDCQAFFYVLLFVVTLMATFVVLLIEKTVFDHSELVEEMAKAFLLLIFWRIFVTKGRKIVAALIIGLTFGISEKIMYLNDIMLSGHFDVLTWRLALTLPMHVLTPLVMAWFANKKLTYLGWGLLSAMLIHHLFNVLVVKYFF